MSSHTNTDGRRLADPVTVREAEEAGEAIPEREEYLARADYTRHLQLAAAAYQQGDFETASERAGTAITIARAIKQYALGLGRYRDWMRWSDRQSWASVCSTVAFNRWMGA